jgi:TRAP-type C4-dicarboxylate transport system substrate-binding protein
MRKQRSPRVFRVAAAVMAVGFGASACAESGGGGGSSSGGGAGVDVGATMEEYQAAFEDIDPIVLNAQTPSPAGSASSAHIEGYMESIEEWSGGAITFEVAYANAIAPAAEIDDALRDGRLDLGLILPQYEPQEYPVTAALAQANILSDQGPAAGSLHGNAWPTAAYFASDEAQAELDEAGMVALVPAYQNGASVLFCAEPRTSLADLEGVTVAADGPAQAAQVSALGASPVTIPYTEVFESLQRGVVDCVVQSTTVAQIGGFLPEAPYATVESGSAFAATVGTMAVSKARWDELPLVAQQLLWDRMPVFLEANFIGKLWPNIATGVTQIQAEGGSFSAFDDDARQALTDANESILDEIRASGSFDGEELVGLAEEQADLWRDNLTDLGFSDADVPWSGFSEWYDPETVDITTFVELLYDEVYLERRPS